MESVAFLGEFVTGNRCRDLSTIGDTVLMSVSKEGIKFSSSGDIGSANITVRQAISAHQADMGAIEIATMQALYVWLKYGAFCTCEVEVCR